MLTLVGNYILFDEQGINATIEEARQLLQNEIDATQSDEAFLAKTRREHEEWLTVLGKKAEAKA